VIQLAELLAIAVSVALVLALVIVVRRSAKLVADTRDTERFKRRVADLAKRVDQSLDGVAGQIDAVRRHTTGAEAIGESIAAAREAVVRYEDEARALRGPAGANEIRDAIAAELGRAARALEMADHGCEILASARAGSRELEAQTSIKRGYLNVLHAREAIARHAARATALGKRETGGLFERRA
jgi:hypothetical protein